MAIILMRSRFLHVPKTGGTWVTQAIARAGIPHVIDERYLRHTNLITAVGQGLFTFAFVRHPATWWQSYWVARMTYGWDDSLPLDILCRHSDFNTFIENVIHRMPGHLTQAVYESFVGRPGAEIDFVGRHERLVDDLIRALRLAGEEFDEAAIRATPPANLGDYGRFDAAYRPEVLQALARAEAESFRRFGYEPRT